MKIWLEYRQNEYFSLKEANFIISHSEICFSFENILSETENFIANKNITILQNKLYFLFSKNWNFWFSAFYYFDLLLASCQWQPIFTPVCNFFVIFLFSCSTFLCASFEHTNWKLYNKTKSHFPPYSSHYLVSSSFG